MPKAYRQAAKPAKNDTEQKVSASRTNVQWFAPVLAVLSRRFPKKLALEMALRANRSDRICARWIAGTDSPNGEALSNLIDSDVGDIVVAALTARCTHPWAKALRRSQDIAKARRALEENKRLLEHLERGE